MKHILKETIFLFRSNFLLFGCIVLTVWLPGNMIVNYLDIFLGERVGVLLRTINSIEIFLGPIYIGAIIFALNKIKQGQSVSYLSALAAGIRNWPRLFLARVLSGLFIVLGLLGLIIPGILLLIRLSLVDSVVVLEGKKAGKAINQSLKLSKGKSWSILRSSILIHALYALIYFILYFMQIITGLDSNYLVSVIVDSLMDVFYVTINIMLFLYYLDSKKGSEEEPVNQNDYTHFVNQG